MAAHTIAALPFLGTRAQAKLRGAKTYWPGKFCCNGHLGIRRVCNRQCVDCTAAAYRVLKAEDPAVTAARKDRTAKAHAARLARDGATMRARQAAALSEALHWQAGGDKQGVTLALSDAKFYARCKRKETQG